MTIQKLQIGNINSKKLNMKTNSNIPLIKNKNYE